MRIDPTTTDADQDIEAPPPTEMAVSALLVGLGAAPVLAVLGVIPIPGLMFFSPVAIGVGVQPSLELLAGFMVGSLMCGGVVSVVLAVPAAIITSKT